MADVVVPYDPTWPAQFETERFALDAILSPWLVAGVHHIGSTAIPNMPAKPILDMMAGVSSLSCTQQAEHALGRVGYRLSPHRVDAALFVRTDAACADTHHLHLTVPAGDLWRERLTFRDALRRDPQRVEECTALKQRLLTASGGRAYDSVDKRTFVRRVLAANGLQLRDDRHAHL